MTISNITGSPVSDDDFYDREWELDVLTRAVQERNNVLLTAPRRVGKSSLVLAAIAWARQRSWTCIQVDVQDCDTEASFLERLVDACRAAGVKPGMLDELAQAAKRVKRYFAGTGLATPGVTVQVPEEGPEDWREAGRLFQRVLQQEAGGDNWVLIGVDELPIFLAQLLKQPQGTARVDLVLRWLRRLRMQPLKGVSWILCGSVGLDTFVEQHKLVGTINDLQLQHLGAFPDSIAVEFLMALGRSSAGRLTLTEELSRTIVRLVGWSLPYYLQLMFHAVKELAPDLRSADYPSEADIRAAYEQLLSPHSYSYFAHWDARLDDQLDAVRSDTARFLLKAICRKDRGIRRDRLRNLLLARSPHADPASIEVELDFALGLLERDGYLMRDKNTWVFRSFLLRDYWRRRFD